MGDLENYIEKKADNLDDQLINDIKKLANDEQGKKLLQKIAEAAKESAGGLRGMLSGLGKKLPPSHVTNRIKDTAQVGALGAGALAGGSIAGSQGAKMYDELAGQGSGPGPEQLERILNENEDLANRHSEEDIQKAWKTMKSHAPRISNSDPFTAGQVMEKLLDYEGVDMQAIEQLLDIEGKKREARHQSLDAEFGAKTGSAYLQELAQKAEEVDNNEMDKEAVNDKFNELKEMVSQYDN